jgi:2-polyprenyl-6-methoxyphenol hydroxylase-like FAD-dependent oxidoreductase
VALGDSVCAFNPVYGQGMSVAAAGASALDRHLRARRRHDGDLTGLARRFQRGLARINAAPWLMATGEDFRVPATVGGAPGRATRFMHRYMDRVLLVATEDRSVRRVLLEVFHLLKPPSALFQPRVVVQVLRRGRVPVV